MITAAPEYTENVMGESVKMVGYDLPRVDQDESAFIGSDDGFDHFLLEQDCTKILVDDGHIFDTFDLYSCFNANKFSFAADYDQIKIDSDALDSYLTYGGEEIKLEFLDGYLGEVEEIFQDNIPQDKYGDGLSDSPTNEVLKLDDPSKESSLGSVGFYSLSSGSNERECVTETSKISSESASALESSDDQSYPLQDQITIQEVQEAFHRIFGYETSNTDKQWLKQRILCGLKNHTEMNNGLNIMDCCTPSADNAGRTKISSSVESPRNASCSSIGISDDKIMPGDDCVKWKLRGCDSVATSSSDVSRVHSDSLDRGYMRDTIVAQKRLRKRTKRYIEESLGHYSRCNIRKCGVSYKSSRDKVVHVKSQKEPCQKGSVVAQLNHEEEILNVACIQVPFGLPIDEGNFKKNISFSGNDSEDCKDNELSVSNESFVVESQDGNSQGEYVRRSNAVKAVQQRKHHKSWTPTEVMKLIEGVTMYGVGRWSEIKRLLFPSSTHRTSVDLKDKWRNLLKASCTQLQSKREEEQGRKPAHQVPKYILRRVRELAVVYPYPREGKVKVSCTTPEGSSFPASTNNMPMLFSAGVGG